MGRRKYRSFEDEILGVNPGDALYQVIREKWSAIQDLEQRKVNEQQFCNKTRAFIVHSLTPIRNIQISRLSGLDMRQLMALSIAAKNLHELMEKYNVIGNASRETPANDYLDGRGL